MCALTNGDLPRPYDCPSQAQLRELRNTGIIDISNNSLSGSIPFCWSAQANWTFFNSSVGFNSLKSLFLHQNALTGTLPSALGLLPSAGSLSISLWDNTLSGPVPVSYANLKALTIAYNPLLVGPLPAGIVLSSPASLYNSAGGSSPGAWVLGHPPAGNETTHSAREAMKTRRAQCARRREAPVRHSRRYHFDQQ